MQRVIQLMKARNNITYLETDELIKLCKEIFERVINVIVGSSVKQYRMRRLSQVNKVAFRPMLAVKPEKK